MNQNTILRQAHACLFNRNMAETQKVAAIWFFLIASIVSYIQLYSAMLNLHTEYINKRMNVARFLSFPSTQTAIVKRLGKCVSEKTLFNSTSTNKRLVECLCRCMFLRACLSSSAWSDRVLWAFLNHGYVWTGENDLKTVTCGRGSFCNRENIYAVLNLHGYVWTRPKASHIICYLVGLLRQTCLCSW